MGEALRHPIHVALDWQRDLAADGEPEGEIGVGHGNKK